MWFNLRSGKTRLEGERWEKVTTENTTGRHVDGERQWQRNMLVILLASFTIIFHCAALRHTLASPAKPVKQKSEALAVISVQDAHNYQHYSIIRPLVRSIVSHIEDVFILCCCAQDQMTCLCYHHTQLRHSAQSQNSDVPSSCRASRIPGGD